MPQGKWFRLGYGTILILLIIFLTSKVDFLFLPIGKILATIFIPVVVSGVFYYLFRPSVRFLAKKIPKSIAILLVFLIAIGLMILFSLLVWPIIRQQADTLVNNFPSILNTTQQWFNSLQHHPWIININQNLNVEGRFSGEQMASQFSKELGNILNTIIGSVSNLVNFIMNFLLLLGLIPFIVYYMLNEDHKFPIYIAQYLPKRIRTAVLDTLKKIDRALGSYIFTMVITSVIFSFFVIIGYFIIGLPYPLLLGLIAFLASFIPYIGALIGAVPAVVVALTISPLMALWVCLVVIIANQVEANLISPKIIGKQLKIHPLTIMLLVIGVGASAGPLGMIIVVPLYNVLKIILLRLYGSFINYRAKGISAEEQEELEERITEETELRE